MNYKLIHDQFIQLLIVPIIIHYHRYKAESRRKQKGLIATILTVHVAIVWICLTSIETCTEKTNGFI